MFTLYQGVVIVGIYLLVGLFFLARWCYRNSYSSQHSLEDENHYGKNADE